MNTEQLNIFKIKCKISISMYQKPQNSKRKTKSYVYSNKCIHQKITYVYARGIQEKNLKTKLHRRKKSIKSKHK